MPAGHASANGGGRRSRKVSPTHFDGRFQTDKDRHQLKAGKSTILLVSDLQCQFLSAVISDLTTLGGIAVGKFPLCSFQDIT